MKKVILGLMVSGFVTLSSFTALNEKKDTVLRTVDCKWRSCTLIGNQQFCTEWTKGNCNQSESGVLTPIR